MKDKSGREKASRLANLRKYISNEGDEALVRDMIEDGLDDEQIFHVLGYVNGAPDSDVLAEDHEFSHVPTDEQIEREQNMQQSQQQGGMNVLQALLGGGGGGGMGGGQPQQPKQRPRR